MGATLGCPSWGRSDFARIDAEMSKRSESSSKKSVSPKKLKKLIDRNEQSLKLLQEKYAELGQRLAKVKPVFDEILLLRRREQSLQAASPGVQVQVARKRVLRQYETLTKEHRAAGCMVEQQEKVLGVLKRLNPTGGDKFISSTAALTLEFIDKNHVADELAEEKNAELESQVELRDALIDIEGNARTAEKEFDSIFADPEPLDSDEEGGGWSKYDLVVAVPDLPNVPGGAVSHQKLPPAEESVVVELLEVSEQDLDVESLEDLM